ncbi:hypothetical protein LCGC14_1689830 [marine sediment metagenome]|uniref:Uncharacterized protein n=1 Tax=marine sediment metagenome TaxID=412755 RepID=A0A0F9HLM2_9ZZZZ
MKTTKAKHELEDGRTFWQISAKCSGDSSTLLFAMKDEKDADALADVLVRCPEWKLVQCLDGGKDKRGGEAMSEDERCGTCGWWNAETRGGHTGFCRCNVPQWVYKSGKSLSRRRYKRLGEGCPCWKPREEEGKSDDHTE